MSMKGKGWVRHLQAPQGIFSKLSQGAELVHLPSIYCLRSRESCEAVSYTATVRFPKGILPFGTHHQGSGDIVDPKQA